MQGLGVVVERSEQIHERELEIRQVKVVLGPARDGLKASGDVVAQESDRAAEKRRYTVGSLNLRSSQQLGERVERISLFDG